MIRSTSEASVFSLWRDSALLDALVGAEHLTTARYEPLIRSGLGSGHVDLLFEDGDRSCAIAGLRLDPNSLITRERSPFVWPVQYTRSISASRLLALESCLTPWLRSLARARPMARESIRRFAPSERFERARAAELLGAAPLQRVMQRMAPFVYARRFAGGAHVWIDAADGALAHAVLADIAASIAHAAGNDALAPGSDRAFAAAWYGVDAAASPGPAASDLVLADRRGHVAAPVRIEAVISPASAVIEVPAPAPLDLLFSFDAADAPAISRFSVTAVEAPLRPCVPVDVPRAVGGSAGTIVIAMSAVARAMRGADLDESEALRESLAAEGFTAKIVSEIDAGDRMLDGAELVHIVGSIAEAHTIAFAQAARRRGIDFLFDLAPRPSSPAGYIENMLSVALRAASDGAERARYLRAYDERRVTGTSVPEPTAEDYARFEALFAELASSAIAVLALEEELADLRAWLPPHAAQRVLGRGVFVTPEPAPKPIGHLVPNRPFALVNAPICGRSHALFTALAAERAGVALVIAGPCYDVEYLQTLRTAAPAAVVLADPAAGAVSAMYRRADIWVDAAPRPRSAAALFRAIGCGALPVLAVESPLARVAGPAAPTFALTSFDEAAAAFAHAMALTDREERIAVLQARIGPRRDRALAFAGVISAYTRVASVV